ncbi:NINE protein [Lonsdalea quercina]|uniref:NINE protein n=2 Tax=Lonsdalea quercina TaxID=71657 RepID=UPI0011139234
MRMAVALFAFFFGGFGAHKFLFREYRSGMAFPLCFLSSLNRTSITDNVCDLSR